jgi:GT2 family glycosyltransferase
MQATPPADRPLASIVIVTFHSADTIDPCLDSIARATPEKHEILVVDNCSADDTGARVRFGGARLIANAENRGFAAACNQGIAASRGDFVVLLNPDTLVTPGWLGRLLKPLAGDVGAVGPLSTYVAADQKVERHLASIPAPSADPFEMARQLAIHNEGRTVETKLLIGFCIALRRDLIEKHGGLDESLFLGNDDLEYSHRLRRLGYRLLIATDALVLHHGQRSFRALSPADRERLVQESSDALQRKLEAEYGEGRVPSPEELWGIEWFRPTRRELISIVIPVWNNLKYTKTCLRSVEQYTRGHEVIVVDNGSTDDTPRWLAERPEIRTIRNERNRGFAAACNQGMSAARGEHVVLLNNDVVVTPGWLEGLHDHFRRDRGLGIVAPRTNFSSGPQLVENVGYRSLDELESFAARFAAENRGKRLDFPRVTGLCMLITGPCRRDVGGMDERFGIGNFEDDDYCLRARKAGFGIAIACDVFVHHFGSRTFQALGVDYQALLRENRRKFREKWGAPTPAAS